MKDLRSTIPINYNLNYPVRDIQGITHIIIHHSATSQGSAKAYARYHIEAYDWPGIAYHYVIDKDGTVNWTLDHHKVGYHCKGMNRKSIGICLTGNFDFAPPTKQQYDALVKLIVNIRAQHNWEVSFHNEYSLKTCPGKLFPKVSLFESIRVIENPPLPEDDYEPTVPIPEDQEGEQMTDPPVITPIPANSGRAASGCFGFLLILFLFADNLFKP
jgi:N-acetyl-anhydromuramyl-L-alanine amidase AmpD